MHIKAYCLSMGLKPSIGNTCISYERDYAAKTVLRSLIKMEDIF